MKRVILLVFICVATLRSQTQIRDTVYTGVSGTLFSGKLVISAPDMTTSDGRTVLRWQQEFTLTSGAIAFDLEPNDTAAPSGTSYLVHFIPSHGGASAEWSERWFVPTRASPLKINQIRVLTTPAIMIQPQQILAGGASVGQCLGWTGASWGPVNCTATGDSPAVLSVFGRTGAITPQVGDYGFSRIAGTASYAQLPPLSYAATFDNQSYSTGTVAVTVGSAAITGTGTSWTSDMTGRLLFTRGCDRAYRFTYVSPTSGTLEAPYGTAPGSSGCVTDPAAGYLLADMLIVPGSAHQLGTSDLSISCFDNGNPRRPIGIGARALTNIDPATYDVKLVWYESQAGTCKLSR